MADYRVYLLGEDGKIFDGFWMSATGVDHAVKQVRTKHKGTRCEIWDGPTCVAKVPA